MSEWLENKIYKEIIIELIKYEIFGWEKQKVGHAMLHMLVTTQDPFILGP